MSKRPKSEKSKPSADTIWLDHLLSLLWLADCKDFPRSRAAIDKSIEDEERS